MRPLWTAGSPPHTPEPDGRRDSAETGSSSSRPPHECRSPRALRGQLEEGSGELVLIVTDQGRHAQEVPYDRAAAQGAKKLDIEGHRGGTRGGVVLDRLLGHRDGVQEHIVNGDVRGVPADGRNVVG